jgi:uncharacterized membrane protein
MHDHPHSTAKIGTHPIHPMLIPFPIAFLIATLFCDFAYWVTGAGGWAVAAMWLLGAALVMGAAAAIAGFVDFFGSERIRALSHAWQHMIGNVIAVTLALVSFGLRWGYGAESMVLPWGLLLSLAIVGILGFTGWRGGDLVYVHGVGMEPHATQTTAGTLSEEEARREPRRAA